MSKRKEIYIFSTVWILIFDKRKEVIFSPQYGYRYLIKDRCYLTIFFYFVVSIGVATYSIIMDVALVIEATEFIYFVTSELMFLASYSFHFVV